MATSTEATAQIVVTVLRPATSSLLTKNCTCSQETNTRRNTGSYSRWGSLRRETLKSAEEMSAHTHLPGPIRPISVIQLLWQVIFMDFHLDFDGMV